MNGRILRFGGSEHDIVQLLLPWVDGGHLDAAESARVAAHVATCTRCQADIAWQRRLKAAIATDGGARAAADHAVPIEPRASTETASSVDAGWAALRARLDADPAPRHAAARPEPLREAARWNPWRWVVALQSAVIVGLAALALVMLPRDDGYRTLGAAGRAGDASIAVVFRPDATELQIRRALRDSGARIVDGPTVTGAYLLGADPALHAAALRQLRQDSAVLRVESLAAGPAR